MAKGNFIEYVVSNNPNKYPNDGEQSGYYWEFYGGANGTTLISFTIVGNSYQAEKGMTWREWIASSYNTDGYVISSSGTVTGSDLLTKVTTDGSNFVNPDDAISEGVSYQTSPHSGSN